MRISDWSSDVCSSDLLIDFWLQGSRLDGLGLVEAIKAFDPTLPIIVISGHGGLDTAVAAIRRGAFDFIEKPFEAERLLHLVARATESERLKFERSEEHTSELQSLMRNSYAVFCLKNTPNINITSTITPHY